ncbi:hypothetical protein Poli38472_010012 [Pythium oligandrum]|uniref:Uncharacterized protein n=1 Tax=Pythium oligandrum TaxID=41045 RepID=A0A8K1FH61_PYTOL|nr:hypothetical protein Poli38472_010012 [Pythium oligandrum]|eukprot:TMW58453.1 hypothetical protein Poli38472_010012 [Pythium oligandrum]
MVTPTYQVFHFSRLISQLWIEQFAIMLNGPFLALMHELRNYCIKTLFLLDSAIYKAIRAVQIPQEALVISAWTYLAIGILHVYEVLAMVFRSLWYRRLVFSAVTKEKRPPEHLHVLDRQTATTRERLCKPFAHLVAVLDRYSGLNGYFGVNGQLFDLVFHSLEVLEMVTQTYQAYQFSRSISHAWIKQFAVAVIVLNGTFPALAHVFLQKNEGARRLVNIVIDLFLDFSSAVLLPVGILTPLLMAFNWTTSSFDPELNVNDVWMTNGIAEARQVLVTSRFDYVASMMPHVGLLLCLNMIKSLLRGAPERRSRRLGHTPSGSTVITLVDLYADINCYRHGQVGTGAEITEPLKVLQRDVLTKITITHCPALEVPEIIREFPRFHTLEIFNSTVAQWTRSAAFTQQHLPFLFQTCFFDTNLSTIPDGLLHDELPEIMEQLVFFRSNITELPESIGKYWRDHEWFLLSFEFTPLRKLPTALSKLHLQALYLTGSAIDEIPDELLAPLQLSLLRLSGSGLKRLPRSIGDPKTLELLLMEETDVATLNPWVEAWLDEAMTRKKPPTVSFYGSAVCSGGMETKYERYCEAYQHSDVGSIAYPFIVAQRPL